MEFPGIAPVFDALESVVVAHFSVDGSLLHGNAGLERLRRGWCMDTWQMFSQPHLDDLKKAQAGPDGVVYRGLLTVGNPETTMQTLTGTVYLHHGELLIIAGYDIDEFERTSTQLLELNEALDTAHRDLIRVHRELQKREQIIAALSLTDALTGIGNRRHFDDKLVTEVARAVRYQQPLSLIMIDIDHFKNVNDRWGHEAGDIVLRDLGALLRQFMRQSDSASRLGGEEFVLLMPGAASAEAQAAAERLRDSVARHSVGLLPGITISLGVSSLQDGETGKQLLARADAALYAAKHAGRNRVIMAMADEGPLANRQPLP